MIAAGSLVLKDLPPHRLTNFYVLTDLVKEQTSQKKNINEK